MSRNTLDAVVVGGGIVGSAVALGLRQRGASVAMLDAATPMRWQPDQPDPRVYAIAADSQALLARLGVWDSIRARRVSPYRGMRVWDAGGGGTLDLQAADLGVPRLGHIVEDRLIADRLQAACEEAGVQMIRESALSAVEVHEDSASAVLADGRRLRARWLFGADGARSAVRESLGIEVSGADYQACGLVAYVQPEQAHAQTCWQRFLPTGPLALLPCADGRVSIVWSLPEAEAHRLQTASDDLFNAELSRASDRVLGALRVDSDRRLFPLKRQLATRMHAGRAALLGDAAHVVHPLAGQGVNLGLRDVAGLLEAVDASQARGVLLTPNRLARWARERHSENTLAAHAFETVHRVYSNALPGPLALRGWALAAANLPPVKRALWRQAAGWV